MFIDSRGKLFGKISIIDLLVVVVLLVAIAGVGYKFTKSKTVSPFVKADNIEIQFFAEEIPDFALTNIKNGDLVKDFEKGATFGNVKNVKIDKSISIGMNAKGEFVKSSKEGYSSVILTASGKGIFDDNGISIDNNEYFIGKTIVLRAGKSVFYCRIYNAEKKG